MRGNLTRGSEGKWSETEDRERPKQGKGEGKGAREGKGGIGKEGQGKESIKMEREQACYYKIRIRTDN